MCCSLHWKLIFDCRTHVVLCGQLRPDSRMLFVALLLIVHTYTHAHTHTLRHTSSFVKAVLDVHVVPIPGPEPYVHRYSEFACSTLLHMQQQLSGASERDSAVGVASANTRSSSSASKCIRAVCCVSWFRCWLHIAFLFVKTRSSSSSSSASGLFVS